MAGHSFKPGDRVRVITGLPSILGAQGVIESVVLSAHGPDIAVVSIEVAGGIVRTGCFVNCIEKVSSITPKEGE